jgi:hypothetical protein
MKLHADAPLGPKGRATMVRRILEEGLALTETAEDAGGPARPQLHPSTHPQRHPARAGRGHRRAAAGADDRPRDRRGPRHGHLDRLGGAEEDRTRHALAPGAAAADPPRRLRRAALAGRRVLGVSWGSSPRKLLRCSRLGVEARNEHRRFLTVRDPAYSRTAGRLGHGHSQPGSWTRRPLFWARLASFVVSRPSPGWPARVRVGFPR